METRDNGSYFDEILNWVLIISVAYFIMYARVLYKEGIEKFLDSINNQMRLDHTWKL